MGNDEKLALGHTLAEIDDGMPNSILTDCEAYGMCGSNDDNRLYGDNDISLSNKPIKQKSYDT